MLRKMKSKRRLRRVKKLPTCPRVPNE